MLFTGLGRSVLEETVSSVLGTVPALRPQAVLKTSGTISSNTDLPAGEYHLCICEEWKSPILWRDQY